MKHTKKLLSFFLTLAVVFGLAFDAPIVAQASDAYTYEIKVSLGNNPQASFDEDYIQIHGGEVKGNIAEFDGYQFNQPFELDLDKAVKLEKKDNTTSYYIKGLKYSGTELIAAGEKNVAAPVTGDTTFVLAYGVGPTVAYTIKYLDNDNNKLYEDEYGFAAVGDKVVVPARRIQKYHSPKDFWSHEGTIEAGTEKYDEAGKLLSVEGGTVIVVRYDKNADNITYDETTEYQYQTTYSTTSSTQGGGTTVINRRGQNGGAAQPAAGNGGGNAGGNAGGGAAEETPAPEPETITEPETPTDVIGIDEGEVAKSGGQPQDKLVRNMIVAIIIAIIAVLSILIALIIADRKRKAQIANTNRKDDNK